MGFSISPSFKENKYSLEFKEFADTESELLYYSVSGGNGYTINRIQYNGSYKDYEALPARFLGRYNSGKLSVAVKNILLRKRFSIMSPTVPLLTSWDIRTRLKLTLREISLNVEEVA